jgi:hypothetical protein
MKRLVNIALACALILGSASAASAREFEGHWGGGHFGGAHFGGYGHWGRFDVEGEHHPFGRFLGGAALGTVLGLGLGLGLDSYNRYDEPYVAPDYNYGYYPYRTDPYYGNLYINEY